MGVFFRFAMAVAGFGASLAMCATAQADVPIRLGIDWSRTLEHGATWLMSNVEPEKLSPIEMHSPGEASRTAPPSEFGTAWFGAAPHVSIVARDWGDARRLAGRLSTTDVFRLSRSSRMVITRVRVGDGIIVPFAQVGLGQWRIDTDLKPGWACDTELAAQLGAGLELRIANVYSVALETDYTVLYREQYQPRDIPYPRFWGAMAAARMPF